MKQFVKKALPLTCAAVAPFFLNADESEAPMLCATKSALATTSHNSSRLNQPMNQGSTNDKITPETAPCACEWANPYVTADFIYWKTQVDNANFAYNGIAVAPDGSPSPSTLKDAQTGHIYHPSFKYEPGFKLGFGLKFQHDGWDFFSQYTWLHATSSQQAQADAHSPLHSMIRAQNSGSVWDATTWKTTSSKGTWSLHFNVLDLELGRDFWISKSLSIRPFTGMKFSWLTQNFDVFNAYSKTDNATQPIRYEYAMKAKQDGVGMRGGCNSAFFMTPQWSIYGDLALSAMFNALHSNRENHCTFKTGVDNTLKEVKQTRTRGHLHTVSSVVEMGLGLRFETFFNNNHYKYLLEAGWEAQVWFDQAAFAFLSNSSTHPGNLSMQGLTIKTGFWF